MRIRNALHDTISKYHAGFSLSAKVLYYRYTISTENALQLDWQQVLPKEKCSYIMGNPPFVGARLMSTQQKKDLLDVYVDSKGKTYKNAGNIDYVSGWFYKASKYMQDTQIQAALVSTNSITQGEQVAPIEEKDAFLAKEPRAAKFFRPWIGAHEFINRYCRYCLWLGEATPAEIRSMPAVMERVAAVRDFRLSSKSAGTVKLADNPLHFHVETIPDNTFLVLPLTSSESRRYVPIGFITPDYLASNLVLVVPNAKPYHFGVLTSNLFMSWMRTVCGRLEMRYRITLSS